MSEFTTDPQFVPVAIASFIVSSKAPADLYLRLSDRMVKVIRRDSPFDIERLKNYEGRAVKYLYLASGDLGPLTEQSNLLLRLAINNKGLSWDQRLGVFRNAADGICRQVLFGNFTQQELGLARDFVDASLLMVQNLGSTNALVKTLREMDDVTSRHLTATSMFAVILAYRAGWTTPKKLQDFGLGGLLHDIGLRDLPEALRNKHPSTMLPEEVTQYQQHPTLGHGRLETIKGISPEVLKMVLQHHEVPSGMGFPNQLRQAAISPMARIIHLANQLAHLVVPTREGNELHSVAQAVEAILSTQSHEYNESVIETLEGLPKS